MAHSVIEVLRQYQETIPEEPGSEISLVRADIIRALRNVNLTHEEREILRALFTSEPILPERDRVNSIGTTSGRPAGGTSQSRVAQQLGGGRSQNANNIRVSRTLRRISGKLAAYLGRGYVE